MKRHSLLHMANNLALYNIIMLDEHKNIIAEFKTTREASISTGIPRRTINNALSDGHMLKQSKTFWEFKKKDTNL